MSQTQPSYHGNHGTMTVTSVGVKYSQKFNTGNYNSLELEVSMWAQLEHKEDASSAVESLQEEARIRVLDEYERSQAANGKRLAASSTHH